MVTDAFPLPFTDRVLNAVAGHEIYNFLDRFCAYNQIRMHLNDQMGRVHSSGYDVRSQNGPNDQIRYQMGCVRRSRHDVGLENGTDHVPTNNGRNFRGLYSGIHVSIPL